MSGYVDECAKELEKIVGKGNVVILDDAWLKKANGGVEKTFHIDAYDAKLSNGDMIHFESKDWTINEAIIDMEKSRYYTTRDITTNFIPNSDISVTPMFKYNELWIKHVKSNGYEIIDIGYPQGKITESIFFNMERSVLNFK